MQWQSLTKSQAVELALARLKFRHPETVLELADAIESEREFGWVFRVSQNGAQPAGGSSPSIPSMVIVNKYSAQVVANAIEYRLDEFIKQYQELLAQNQSDSSKWCGTVGFPLPWRWLRGKSAAERAKENGFYEIRAQEERG